MAENLTPEVLAIHQWIRDDAPVTIQMTITPTLIAALAEKLNAARAEDPHTESGEASISTDGPHMISSHRRWLARQFLDSQLSDAEAFGIVAHHPAMIAASPPLKGEALPVAWQVRTRGKTTWSSWWHSDEKPDPTDFDGGYGVEIRPLYARPVLGVSRDEVALHPDPERTAEVIAEARAYMSNLTSVDGKIPEPGRLVQRLSARLQRITTYLALLSREVKP